MFLSGYSLKFGIISTYCQQKFPVLVFAYSPAQRDSGMVNAVTPSLCSTIIVMFKFLLPLTKGRGLS